MLRQAFRAALLDRGLYKEIEDGPQSMLRAFGIVVAAAIAFGLGARNLPLQASEEPPTWVIAFGEQNVRMLSAASSIIVGWGIWACVVYLLGSRLLGGKAGYRKLMRSLGIAYGPAVLLVFFGVPQVGSYVATAAVFWLLATCTVATQETQGFGFLKAFVPSVLGWTLGLWILPGLLL